MSIMELAQQCRQFNFSSFNTNKGSDTVFAPPQETPVGTLRTGKNIKK